MTKRFRLTLAVFSAVLLTIAATAILTVAAASSTNAQWPTSCVELNDVVEAHAGNDDNVGIYQRTFGDDAEQACRNDHRDDVRSLFAWAINDRDHDRDDDRDDDRDNDRDDDRDDDRNDDDDHDDADD